MSEAHAVILADAYAERNEWRARALRAEAAGEHADALLAKAEERALKAEANLRYSEELLAKAIRFKEYEIAARLKAEEALRGVEEATDRWISGDWEPGYCITYIRTVVWRKYQDAALSEKRE